MDENGIVENEKPDKLRIWMGPETSIEQRVSRYVNQPLGSIHHLDIELTSVDLMRECGKLNSFEGMKNAQEILDRIIEEKKFVNESEDDLPLIVIPDRPFKQVMYGWANMCQKVKVAPQRMREVLELMIEEAEYDKTIRKTVGDPQVKNTASRTSCEPTVDIYNTLLQGLSQAAARSIQAAIEAEHVLKIMDKANRNRGWHTKPNTRSYSLVLNAYNKSRHATGGDRAESVLRTMIERHEYEKNEYLEEYGVEYNIFDPDPYRRKIVTPDTIAYTTVIQAHVNSDSPDSAEKALVLLNEMVNSENPLLEPDAFAFASTINAFSKMAAQKKNPKDRVKAAECAEDILWMMVEEMKNKTDVNKLTGSIVPFNACLNAWAQSFTRESPHRADDLLHRMLDPELQEIAEIYPNTVSFNTCMQAWAKACKFGETAAPEKAEELLSLLIELSNEDGDNPESGRNWDLRPDVRSYVTVMNAYALSRKEDCVFHTRRLFSDLIEGRGKNDKINASPFTIILKAAANVKTSSHGAEGEEHAFGSLDDQEDEGAPVVDPYSIALQTYSELLKDTYNLGVDADHFAFAEMLAVIGNHTSIESIERRQRIEEVFGDACQAGQVSSLVVRAMQKACPNDGMLRELLRLRGNDSVASIESVNSFPRQWTSRVPQEFRRVSSRNEHFQKQSKFFRANKPKGKKNQGRKGPSKSQR
eukprot:jgi/Psemu1/195623/e_gw1.175.82.1